MDDLTMLLRTNGFRATSGRIALLRALKNARRPLTASELGRRLDLNVVTLYRALNDLADAGLLLRGVGKGDAMHFSYPNGRHHHHMICADCGYASACTVC